MICERCGGKVPICPDCGGTGISHCCEGEVCQPEPDQVFMQIAKPIAEQETDGETG